MKGITFQLIASSVALAVMAGMVGIHWSQLDVAGNPESGSDLVVLAEPAEALGGMIPVSTGGGESLLATSKDPVSPESVQTATVQALQEVVSVLKEMKSENENLRDQLMEANRDINGMQIQIDGYSGSFRPLKLAPTEEGVYDSGNPLLPPKSYDSENPLFPPKKYESGNPLLPPKSW